MEQTKRVLQHGLMNWSGIMSEITKLLPWLIVGGLIGWFILPNVIPACH